MPESTEFEQDKPVSNIHELIEKWKHTYPDSLGDLIYAFYPEDMPYPSGRITESYGCEFLQDFVLWTPNEISDRISFDRDPDFQVDSHFVADVNHIFGDSIEDIRQFQQELFDEIQKQYPFASEVEEALQISASSFAEFIQPDMTDKDSLHKLVIATRLTEDKLGFRRSDTNPRTPNADQFNKFYQRFLMNIDTLDNDDSNLDVVAREAVAQKMDTVITRFFEQTVRVLAKDCPRQLRMVPVEYLKIYPEQWVYKGETVESYLIHPEDLQDYTVSLDYYKRYPTVAMKEYRKLHAEADINSYPQFQFIDSQGKAFVLFAGNLDDTPPLMKANDGTPQYQLNFTSNAIATERAFRSITSVSNFSEDSDYSSGQFALNCWSAMTTKVIEILSVNRELIRLGKKPPEDVIQYLQVLQQSHLGTLFDQDYLYEYDGSREAMRKIVALQTIRQGIPFVTARDKQAQLQGNPDIFEVLEVKRYEPVNHRELFSHSGDAMRSGGVGRELISRDEYERYKKMVELHGIIHGPFRTSEFLEFTDETEPHTHQNVQLPLVDGVTDWRLKLQTAFQVSSSGKKIPLVTSRNLSISAMQLHSYGDPLQPDKDYVVYEIAPNTVEIELRRDMDVSMTVVFTENTSVSSLTKEPINDSKEGQQRLQKFINLLEQRSEPAYKKFAEKLKEGASNRMTIGDIVNIQRSITDYSFNSSLHYLRSTSVLDQLSMFAREEHFTMQCGQSSELLLFCLTELFQGNDEIYFERVSGYNVDTDNISGILNTEEYFIQIRASDRHSLVKATRKGEVSYLDATGINVQRSRELPKTKRSISIQDVNNRYKKQEEITFSSVVDQQLNWITNTMNNLVPPDKRRVISDGGLGLIADLPHDDPLRQVVKLLLHYKDDKITEKDVRQSLIHIEEEFSLSSAEALRTYYMQLDGGRRSKKLAFLMQFLVTGTVQSILS